MSRIFQIIAVSMELRDLKRSWLRGIHEPYQNNILQMCYTALKNDAPRARLN